MCPHCAELGVSTGKDGIARCHNCGLVYSAEAWKKAGETRKAMRAQREALANPPAQVTRVL